MVVWGKKTWYFLPSDAVPSTPHTIETGEENERIDITPDSHPHLPWLVAVAYTGDVIFVPAFFCRQPTRRSVNVKKHLR